MFLSSDKCHKFTLKGDTTIPQTKESRTWSVELRVLLQPRWHADLQFRRESPERGELSQPADRLPTGRIPGCPTNCAGTLACSRSSSKSESEGSILSISEFVDSFVTVSIDSNIPPMIRETLCVR